MDSLPPDATVASKQRYELAREFAQGCSSRLGREIALTGSVSRGIADEFSDVEINFWVDRMPSREEREACLLELGAADIQPKVTSLLTDGSLWTTCRYGNVWLELGWVKTRRFDELIQRIAAGEVRDHDTLIVASAIVHAIPLRTRGTLAHWQKRLENYPPHLAAQIIEDNTQVWSDPHTPMVRWALVRRGERMALAMRLLWDMQNVWRVLFAINQAWEPDWKWISAAATELAIRPIDLELRNDRVFTLDEPHRGVTTCFELIRDTLNLVPAGYDVSRARDSIQAALDVAM